MLELRTEQKTIYKLFSELENYFLIPDYQRSYSWEQSECETLWEDITEFAFSSGEIDNFDKPNKYFLGTIVFYENSNDNISEVIDGQQRLTTIILLLRAFYEKYENMIKTEDDKAIFNLLSQCIWKKIGISSVDKNKPKLLSKVAFDDDNLEFLDILKNGSINIKNSTSKYAKNYNFFIEKIEEFVKSSTTIFVYLPNIILNNCIFLPISTKTQEDALQIFSTLNDRGKPLSDSDIFKSQFYKYFVSINKKNEFLDDWDKLLKQCKNAFDKTKNDPTNEIFIRYMHCIRAEKNIKSNSVEGLRKFYEKDNYKLLKNDETFEDLKTLANFWSDVSIQNKSRFSDNVLKQLFILNFAPNNMWTFIVSVYFMNNKDEQNSLNNEKFELFLKKIIAFILATEFVYPGVSNLKTPIFNEILVVKNHQEITFKDYLFFEEDVRNSMQKFHASNNKKMTRSILSWWIYNSKNKDNEIQSLLSLNEFYDIEHIFPKSKLKFGTLNDENLIDSLGNKSLLESSINNFASNYTFPEKQLCYLGKIKPNKATKIVNLLDMANDIDLQSFKDKEINERTELIINSFVQHLKDLKLIKIK